MHEILSWASTALREYFQDWFVSKLIENEYELRLDRPHCQKNESKSDCDEDEKKKDGKKQGDRICIRVKKTRTISMKWNEQFLS